MALLITKKQLQETKSRAEVPLSCPLCKKTFHLAKNRYQDGVAKYHNLFCSRKCSGLFHTTSKEIECENCKKKAIRTLGEIRDNPHHFCSHSCSAQWHMKFKRTWKKHICRGCGKQFECPASDKGMYCSRGCYYKTKERKKILVKCSQCGNEILKYEKSPHKFRFCNNSCKAKYANRTWNRGTRFGNNKSKAEKILADIIKTAKPSLLLIENDRSVLPDGLEIDIWLPTIPLAIELNGPIHYIPMFGEEALAKTKNRDHRKMGILQEKKIPLMIINIHGVRKNQQEFLQGIYDTQIAPLLP